MDHSKIVSQTQVNIHVQGKINDFFNRFQIGTLMHRCGVRKRHGHSVRSLTEAIFTLPFVGKNFFHGIVINEDKAFGKDAAWKRMIVALETCFMPAATKLRIFPLSEPSTEFLCWLAIG